MKTILSFTSIGLILAIALLIGSDRAQIKALTAEIEALKQSEDFELAAPMGLMQTFSDKLYFAGRESNWALASFYLHEIEEQIETIEGAHVIEDGIDVSQMIGQVLLPQIEQLEADIAAGSQVEFSSHFGGLVNRCNSCHSATDHGFIQLRVPSQSMFENQLFKVQ